MATTPPAGTTRFSTGSKTESERHAIQRNVLPIPDHLIPSEERLRVAMARQ
jgi:hypothetical protein